MTPTIVFCSWLAGRCFALNVAAVEASYQACDHQMAQVELLAARLADQGALPADLFIYQRECVQ